MFLPVLQIYDIFIVAIFKSKRSFNIHEEFQMGSQNLDFFSLCCSSDLFEEKETKFQWKSCAL